MSQYVLQDINVRDKFVSASTDFLLHDEKVIVQSLWRLITTQEGEIPNFRVYGLDIKRFSQYPMTAETIEAIFNYVKGRVSSFETRAEVVRAEVDTNFETGEVFMNLYVRIRNTGNVIKLPTWTIQVSTT